MEEELNPKQSENNEAAKTEGESAQPRRRPRIGEARLHDDTFRPAYGSSRDVSYGRDPFAQRDPYADGYQQRNSYQGSYQRPQGGYRRYEDGQSYHRPAAPHTYRSFAQQTPAAEGSDNNTAAYNAQEGAAPAEHHEQQRPSYGGYQPRPQQGGYQRPQQGYGRPRQGGYGRPQQGGYGRPQQGGYQQGGYGRPQQGGYQQSGYQQGGYGRPQQGGYQQGGYGRPQQGGYQQGGYQQGGYGRPQQGGYQQGGYGRPARPVKKAPKQKRQFTPPVPNYIETVIDPNEEIRLNKFLANAGICSRREADQHIQDGNVKVNGNVVTELGTKVTRKDQIEFNGNPVSLERKIYVLLNKPKDTVTTSDDPQGRQTVLDLVRNAAPERIYPVGRLDRNTTGVLLLTNDGDLASKLTHPKYVKKKIYHVWLDHDVAQEDLAKIAAGIELEDGPIHADAIAYATETDKNQVGIEIHSGKNRIVRRIFEHLGYRVVKLDRVYFAGLTKKNLPRGRWRHLTQQEVNMLKMGAFE